MLFVGEALVSNEAVDQLVKFNRALIDYADSNDQNPFIASIFICPFKYDIVNLLVID